MTTAPRASLNEMAQAIHVENRHWWVDLHTGERIERNVGEMFMLMVSEIAEAMEGERKNLMDDKLPHRKMAEVELADALIRILDFAGANNLDLDGTIADMIGGASFPENKGEALLEIVRAIVHADYENYRYGGTECLCLCSAVTLIEQYSVRHGYDLYAAVAEKRAYNQTRVDHQREACLAANGKKW